MDATQVTLDRWLDAVHEHHFEMMALLNKFLTAIDELDKSLCAIASKVGDLK